MLTLSSRTKRRSLIIALACMAAMGSLAVTGTASAVVWNTQGASTQLQGTLTLKLGGSSPQVCNVATPPQTVAAFNAPTAKLVGNVNLCGATYRIDAAAYPSGSGYTLYNTWGNGNGCLGGPYGGTWCQYNVSIPFTNAAGGTPSHLTFSDLLIGRQLSGSPNITATGTLDVTTSSGGALTLN